MSLDVLLVTAGLIALACVMAFLMLRPGRKQRAEMSQLLTRSAHAAQAPDHSIFISYRRSDSADIVGRLYEHLTSEHGRKAVFKDVDAMIPGGDFRVQLDQSLGACRVLICVMGDQWAGPVGSPSRKIDDANDFVRIEIETALRRGIPVIPVFVRGTAMPPPDFFPESLRGLAYRQGLALRPDPDFRNDAARLNSSVAAHLEGDRKAR